MTALQTCTLAFLLCGQAPVADEPGPASREGLLQEFLQDAKTYEITLRTDPPAVLQLNEKPVLNWVNPAANDEDGVVYVWTKDGRPEVIASVWNMTDQRTMLLRRKHAFHSLSDAAIEARTDSQLIWAPKTPGLSFRSVPGAESPAVNARLRFTQMRALARQFTVSLERLRGEKSELRLLTQPLFRYEPSRGPVKEGAIFAFATGTDPDALLVLEARETADGLQWQYAFARFHFVQVTAFHKGQEVWKVEKDPELSRARLGEPAQQEKVYYSAVRLD